LEALDDHIRAVTGDEVAFFETSGWVFLPRLLSRELAAELRSAAEPRLKELEDGRSAMTGLLAGAGVEPFRRVVWSRELAGVAHGLVNRARLTGREIATHYGSDMVWRKGPGCGGTAFHQDSGNEGADRIGSVDFWIALDTVTPEMGGLRFLTGSHREGPLGRHDEDGPFLGDGLGPLLTRYERLLDLYEWSPPLHFEPGDATVHKGWTLHGSPTNRTDRDRWAWILDYTAADTRYRDGTYGCDQAVPGQPLGSDSRVYP
jgi:hypothetical protein